MMMNTILLQSIVFETLLMLLSPVNLARIPGAENPPSMVNLPSLDLIDEHPAEPVETKENEVKQAAGPSLDIIDFHPHDENHSSTVEDPKEPRLIQPSFEILDAQLHGGNEHVHEKHERTDGEAAAANLDDYYRWLKEQNQTDQLHRFLSLQKEVNQFHLKDSDDLTEKLNRTIEELKLAAFDKRSKKHEL